MFPRRRRIPGFPIILALFVATASSGCGRGGMRTTGSVASNDSPFGTEVEPAGATNPSSRDSHGQNVPTIVQAGGDQKNALAWTRMLPDAARREEGLRAIGTKLAASDFSQALALSADFRAGAARDEYVREIAQARARFGGDPYAVERWARGIGDMALREKVLSAVAVELAQNAPAEAAALVARSMVPGPEQDAAAVTVAMRWSVSDPAAAVDWAAQQPAGSGRDTLLRATLERWVETDAPAASNWIGSLPIGPLREEAMDRYVDVWAGANPAAALDWAVANGREVRIAGIVHQWFTNHSEEARAWVASAPLSDDAKYHLIYDDPTQERHDPR